MCKLKTKRDIVNTSTSTNDLGRKEKAVEVPAKIQIKFQREKIMASEDIFFPSILLFLKSWYFLCSKIHFFPRFSCFKLLSITTVQIHKNKKNLNPNFEALMKEIYLMISENTTRSGFNFANINISIRIRATRCRIKRGRSN